MKGSSRKGSSRKGSSRKGSSSDDQSISRGNAAARSIKGVAHKSYKGENDGYGLQVPPYWKNKTGINFVATNNFVQDALQRFMVESSCCPTITNQTRVVSVERVENERLWREYQVRKDTIKKNCVEYAQLGILSLSTATNWQPAWCCNVKKDKYCDNPRLRCHRSDFDMCIKCAKAETETKKKADVEANTAAEAKAGAETEEKAAAEKKAAGGRCGVLRYIIPSCIYPITDGGGAQHGHGVNHDVSTGDEQGGGGEDEACCCSSEMSTDINEFYMFHGTSLKKAMSICQNGFNPKVAARNCLYGKGSYFAINSCKSHQYSSQNPSNLVMLVCRVAMGSSYPTTGSHEGQKRPPMNRATPGRHYDSIFAQREIANGRQQKHNEYVVFDRDQVYPEYIVQYTVEKVC